VIYAGHLVLLGYLILGGSGGLDLWLGRARWKMHT